MRSLFNAASTALLFLLVLVLNSKASSFSCPSYEALAQPSVDPSVFSIEEFGGLWSMIATNEPTLPPMCTCSTNDVTVSASSGTYAYRNSNRCSGAPMSVSIAGKLSSEPLRPGDLKENLDTALTQMSLKPNMLFHALRDDATGEIDVLFTYACISRSLFSFNVLSRRTTFSTDDIEGLIDEADTLTNHLMKTTGMRIANETVYEGCAKI